MSSGVRDTGPGGIFITYVLLMLVPEGVAETSQIFLQDIYQNDLTMRNTAGVTGDNPIAAKSKTILGVSDDNPLVAFYDIH
jgi:hypothetical protein